MIPKFTVEDIDNVLDKIDSKIKEWDAYEPENTGVYNTLAAIYNTLLEKRSIYVNQFTSEEKGFIELEHKFEKYEENMKKI
jgi:hypothetical protein